MCLLIASYTSGHLFSLFFQCVFETVLLWFTVVYSCFSWFSVFSSRWFTVVSGDLHMGPSIMIYIGFSLFTVVSGGFRWFTVVYDGL